MPGDWNAFFGLGTNVLLNVLVLSGLALFVVELSTTTRSSAESCRPSRSRCHSATCSTPSWRIAWPSKEGRDDVTSMPYGPSVPHYFFVTFVIMLPIVLRGGTPLEAWMAGLAWAFIVGVIVLIGAFVGPTIRRFTPRAAMLGTLAGISIAFISMRPAFQMFEAPWIALPVLAIILLSLDRRRPDAWRYPRSASLAVIVGTAIGWIAYADGRVDRDGPHRRSVTPSRNSGSTCRSRAPRS